MCRGLCWLSVTASDWNWKYVFFHHGTDMLICRGSINDIQIFSSVKSLACFYAYMHWWANRRCFTGHLHMTEGQAELINNFTKYCSNADDNHLTAISFSVNLFILGVITLQKVLPKQHDVHNIFHTVVLLIITQHWDRRIGDKPWSEPMILRFAYAYMRH